MSPSHWFLIATLAIAAAAIRVTGLLAGSAIRRSRFAPILDDLPGAIIVSLVAASLADQPPLTWLAAAAALATAWRTRDVIATMVVGVAVFAGLSQLIAT